MSNRGWDNTGGTGAEAPRPPDFVTDVAPTAGVPATAPPRAFGESVGGETRDVGGSPAGGPAGDSTATVAGEGAKEVAGEVRNQAAQVAGEARTQALGAMRSAQDELRGHASQQTDRAAQGLHGLAGQIQALVEGRT